MTSTEAGVVPWFVRVARVGAAALAILATLSWITPVNVRSQSGVFGCGSPADPKSGTDLIDLVCRTDLDLWRTIALALLLAAGATLFVSEVVAPRWGERDWVPGVVASSPVGFSVMALSIGAMFAVIGGTTPTGSPFRCGTAIAPAADAISTVVCGQLADTRRNLGVGGVVIGAGILLAGAYLSPRSVRPGASSEPEPPAALSATDHSPMPERHQ